MMGIVAVACRSMRLYRGLKNPYRPERVDASSVSGTNFTDCPAVALLYAQSSRGAVVVVDIDYDEGSVPRKVFQALWPEREARRYIIRGRFDDLIAAVFPAKELRTRLRRERLRNALHATKARVLHAVIDDELRHRALRRQFAPRSEIVERVGSHEHGRVSSHER